MASDKRRALPFTWSASCGMACYAVLAGVPLDRLFVNVDAIIDAYTIGKPLAAELFGDAVALGGPGWPYISYGHVNCLGAALTFPEDSEVGHTPVYDSLAEGIAALRREVDFTKQGMMPHYLAMWEQLKRAFPEEPIAFHFTAEGPLTTGWLLRGHDFFAELLTEPEAVAEYLRLVTASIIAYHRCIQRINGWPEFSPVGVGIADDIAAMVAPDRWPMQVLPYLEQYYQALTSGERWAHIEDLTIHHLPYLDQLRLDSFDPSVSPKLTPRTILEHCGVPFQWRLNSTHYDALSRDDIARWVYHAAANGASSVFTTVLREMLAPEARELNARKVLAFVLAAKRVKSLLDAGCARDDLMNPS
ncbi:MAG: Uroporphyrinogen decarboxylase (URO-D) [bacterium ADurb.Bin429]|nr:MAG: Uroporphyrinogen decarboxylase (URO-D) [bacterium ADurb.Bin429]